MQIQPLKKLGQNFLMNKGVVEKIVKAACLKQDDVVLEIGPGLGVLTKELARNTGKVISIEKDARLIDILKKDLKDFKNVEIINEDILNFQFSIFNFQYKVVANLPFNIASAVIQKFLETENKPECMILLVQKEVAQRIVAKPPKMSILAVSVQLYAEAKILFYVSKGSFRPSPKVDAACLKITPKNLGEASLLPNRFFETVRTGFSHPRKQLGSNLPKDLLLKAGIDPARRAETLTVEEWLKLTG